MNPRQGYFREYRKTERYKEYIRKYHQSDEYKNYQKKYQEEYRKRNQSVYHGYRYQKVNPDGILAKRLRTRLYVALKKDFKSGSAVRDLGCSIQELRVHLEKKFQIGMTWENYGKWHIDHIKPLSKFNLTEREELLLVSHYTNLQPLWARENIIKGNK